MGLTTMNKGDVLFYRSFGNVNLIAFVTNVQFIDNDEISHCAVYDDGEYVSSITMTNASHFAIIGNLGELNGW